MKESAEREQPRARQHWDIVLYPLLLGLALFLRIGQLGAFVTWSEPAWAFRCARFSWALSQRSLSLAAWRDPGGTVALWAGSLGLALHRLLGGGAPPAWQGLTAAPVFDPQDPVLLRQVAQVLPAATLAVAVLNALLAILLAFLVARIWGARAGLFAGLLLAVAPCYLAHSRLFAADAPTAGLAVGALLALLWALKDPRSRGRFLLSGVLAGLAALNQGEAAILAPYALLLLAATHLALRRPALTWLRNTALWGLAFVAGCLIPYPATWAAPLAAVRALAAYAISAVQPSAQPEGSLAAASVLPLALRMTPLSLGGLVLALLRLPFDHKRHRMPALALLVFAAVSWWLSWAGEAQGQSALIAMVVLEVAAAVGLDGLAAAGAGLLPPGRQRLALGLRAAASLAVLAAIGWQAAQIVSYRPYYPAYRNPWLAGQAPARDGPGWGEGMDRVAAYLNDQPGAERLRVATPDVEILAPLFAGEVVPLDEETVRTADYVAVYNRDWLRPGLLPERLPLGSPDEVVRLYGIEYARIYANRLHEPIVALLASQAQADDLVLLDAPSPFGHHYQGPAPYHELRVESVEQAAQELSARASGRWRLWHVAFNGADPRHVLRGLLERHAMLLQQWEVAGASISLYLLPLEPHFGPLLPGQAMGVDFPGGLSLESAGLAETHVQYRQKIALALQWRTGSEPLADLAISLRLIDGQGALWAQQDSTMADASGRFTGAWDRGATVRSEHILSLPPGVPPGPYRLRAVFYKVDSHEPLVPLHSATFHEGEVIDLFGLEVLPAQVPPDIAELKLEHPLQVALADGIELLGGQVDAGSALPGQELPLTLWWRATQPMTLTYQAHLMLLDANGDLRSERTVDLAGPQHSTTAWAQGEVIEGRYSLTLSPGAAAGEAIVGVELVSPLGRAREPVRLGTVKVRAIEHVFQPPPIQVRRWETLGQAVRLLGYDLGATSVRAGQALPLTLYWQCLAPLETSYTVFTHLLDPTGQMCCGHDSIPAGGARPTPGWVLHEILTDPHEIAVPASAQPGRYTLEVGLYDASTGARLPAYDAAGARLAQDRILLGTVDVTVD